jgi:hypothetical protein
MTTEFIVLPDQQNIHVSQSLGACSGTLKLRSKRNTEKLISSLNKSSE